MFRRLLVSMILLLNVYTVGAVLSPSSVGAQVATSGYCSREGSNFLGFPTWYKYLTPTYVNGSCELTFLFPDSLPAILLAIFEILLRVAGVLAVLFVIYGGFQYLTSTGEPDKAKGARTTIINALVGVVIASFATVIVNLIGGNLAP